MKTEKEIISLLNQLNTKGYNSFTSPSPPDYIDRHYVYEILFRMLSIIRELDSMRISSHFPSDKIILDRTYVRVFDWLVNENITSIKFPGLHNNDKLYEVGNN